MDILIVDDSRAMRMIVKRVLGQTGYSDSTFHEAADGAEALAFIKANRPDLVLSDWNMPEMTGIELLHALKGEGIDVRFGFVTSESTPDMREQAIAGGALFLIAKPFTADSFDEVLSSVAAG
jgi:two-component system chemotaxis response regulator CheY